MSELREYQKELLEITGEQQKDYRTWLLENSRDYTNLNKDLSIKYSKNAKLKGCYSNCFKIVMRNRKLKFIDGTTLALGMAIDHAFLINEDNEIIDPTLALDTGDGRDRFGVEYFGMEIPRIDLIKISADERNTFVPLSFLYWKLKTDK